MEGRTPGSGEGGLDAERYPEIGRIAGELSFESRRRNADDGQRGAFQAQIPADSIDASGKRALPECMAENRDQAALWSSSTVIVRPAAASTPSSVK